MIQKHNENSQYLPFTMEVNAFVDRSVDEFLEHHKLRVPKHLLGETDDDSKFIEEERKHHHRHHQHQKGREDAAPFVAEPEVEKSDVTLPPDVNWYLKGAVSTPSNQQMCGSCWAFTTAATLESLAVISGKFE